MNAPRPFTTAPVVSPARSDDGWFWGVRDGVEGWHDRLDADEGLPERWPAPGAWKPSAELTAQAEALDAILRGTRHE